MASPKGMDSSGMKGGNMLSGLTRKTPPGMDKSGMIGGNTINKDATRDKVGGQPTAPGPREA